jgi:hypothetical protein
MGDTCRDVSGSVALKSGKSVYVIVRAILYAIERGLFCI